MPILMVTPDDEDVDVEEADFESAKASGLEPAFEMVDRDGSVNVVRKRHMADAEKSGMTAKPVWDALNTKTNAGGSVGKAEAVGRGFANMTGPIADEAVGFSQAPVGGIKAAVGGLFGVNQADDRDVQEYQAKRNAYRERDEQAWEERPGYYGTGGALGVGAGFLGGGAAVTGLGKALAPAAGASRLARGGNAARVGAATGAVQGVGGGTDAQGQPDLGTGDVAGVRNQAEVGGLLGGLFGAGGEEAADFLRRSAPKIQEMAGERAAKATGTMLADQRKLAKKPGGVAAFGNRLLEEGVVTAGASLDDIAERSASQKKAMGQGIGDILDKLDQFGEAVAKGTGGQTDVPLGMNMDTFATRVQSELIEPLRKTSTGNQTADLIAQELDAMRTHYGKKGFIPFKAANAEKSALDDVIYRGNKALSDDPKLVARQELRRILNTQIENDADQLVGKFMPEFKDQFRSLKSGYGTMADASRISADKVSRNQANRIISPSDYGTMIGGGIGGVVAAGGNPLGALAGLALGAANNLGRNRGPQMTASSLNKLGKALQRNGQAFSKYAGILSAAANKGDESLELAHYALFQSDPEYRNLVDTQGGNP